MVEFHTIHGESMQQFPNITIVIFLGTVLALGGFPSKSFPLENCSCNPKDQYNPKARMPEGLFKGQCINSCEQRSVKIIKRDY